MSNLENFTTQITSLITSLVLTPLADWLTNEKKVNVSVDELLDVLKIPKTSKTQLSTLAPIFTTSVAKTESAKNLDGTSGRVSSKSSVQAIPKSKPPSPENYNGPTCKYVFKRGDLKGKECGKPVVNGSDFCEQCSGKKTNKIVEPKQTKIVETTTGNANRSTQQNIGFTSPLAKKTEKPKIELRETGQPNTYIDIQTNIVVKKVVDKDRTLYIAVGVQEESGFRTLTEEEKKEALNRNFSLSASDSKSESRATENKLRNETSSLNLTDHERLNESSSLRVQDKKIVSKQPVNNIPDIDSDNE